MSVMNSQELKTLIKIEHLLWVEGKKIFGKNYQKQVKYCYQGELDYITYDDFMDFYSVVDKVIADRKKLSKSIAEYHKANRDKHNAYNREWAKRKRNQNKIAKKA